MQDRLVTAAWAVAIALLATSVAAAGPGATLAEAQPPPEPVPACSQLLVVGVRGSGQDADGPRHMGRTVGPYVEKAAQHLPAAATAYYALPYPAVPAVSPEYGNSVEAGTNATVILVRDRITKCPGIRIGLVGYSQGAQVVSEALRALTPAERGFVQSVLLLADPTSAGDTSYDIAVTVQGRPGTHPGGGVLGRILLPADIQGRTTDFCIQGDPVCDQPAPDKQSNLASYIASPVHGLYPECCGDISFPDVLGSSFADRLRPSGLL